MERFFCAQGNGCPLTDWQGYILLTVENNVITHQRLLRPDEWVMGLDCFIEMARRADWEVTPVRHRSGD
ncbi:hypothetical protein [Serratia marcescens]|uniref:hypothetical protein n=1 Tax=Serratia marcescens TaxID=615 RepID=UPI0011E7326F|nr:hypothetical protein [Serratia marcescens]